MEMLLWLEKTDYLIESKGLTLDARKVCAHKRVHSRMWLYMYMCMHSCLYPPPPHTHTYQRERERERERESYHTVIGSNICPVLVHYQNHNTFNITTIPDHILSCITHNLIIIYYQLFITSSPGVTSWLANNDPIRSH